MNKERLKFWRRVALDLLVVDATAVLIFYIRFHSGFLPTIYGIPPWLPYFKLLGLANIIWMLFAQFSGAYRRDIDEQGTATGSLFRLYLGVCFAILIFVFIRRRSFEYSMTVICSSFIIILPVVVLARLVSTTRIPARPTALIGSFDEVKEITEQYGTMGLRHIRYTVAYLTDVTRGELAVPLKSWRGIDVLTADIRQVLVAPSFTDKQELRKLVAHCTGREIVVRYIPRWPEVLGGDHRTGLSLQLVTLNMRREPLSEYHNRLAKRTFDVLVAIAALVGLGPVMLAVAVAVWIRQGRPIIILQKRQSLDGKNFRMLKFRTMRPDAEEESGPVWAAANDDRCTPIGSWLRRRSLDELPQFWNVLRGDMSIVGPRPERPYFTRQFAGDMIYYRERHRVKTGITGWAQVNGLRGDTCIEARTRYDLYYNENWTIWFDIKIVLLTLYEFIRQQSGRP